VSSGLRRESSRTGAFCFIPQYGVIPEHVKQPVRYMSVASQSDKIARQDLKGTPPSHRNGGGVMSKPSMRIYHPRNSDGIAIKQSMKASRPRSIRHV